MMFLRAARSMAAFAGICDGGTTDDGCLAAARDATTINALKTLHSQKYDKTRALQDLVKNPVPMSADQKWQEEDKKKFVKGLKQWGKNFFKIRKELLPHKTTGECIEFYYLWKKSPTAANQRPRQRVRRPQTTILRRIKSSATVANAKTSRPASNEFLDFSSASENESEADDLLDTRDLPGYACHHCYATTSKDWHHAGKDRALLCRECRLYFKKYGELRSVNRPTTPPPYLFKPVKDEFFGDYIPGVRTRGRSSASKDFTNSVAFSLGVVGTSNGKKRPMTPTPDMESARKSPSAASTTSTTSCSSAAESEPAPTPTPAPGTGGPIKRGPGRGKKGRRRKGPVKRRKQAVEDEKTEPEVGRESPESSQASSASTPSSPKIPPPPNEIVGATIDDAIARVTATLMGPTESEKLAPVDLPLAQLAPVEEAPPATEKEKLAQEVYEFKEDPLSESLGQFKKQINEVVSESSTPLTLSIPKMPEMVKDPVLAPLEMAPGRQVAPLAPTTNGQQILASPMGLARDQVPAPVTTTSVIQVVEDAVKREQWQDEQNKENQMEFGGEPVVKEPEAKLDDTVMELLPGEERSNSKFRRHWYRGETNSCCRTDLIFAIKEGSNWAKILEGKKLPKEAPSTSIPPQQHVAAIPVKQEPKEPKLPEQPKLSPATVRQPPVCARSSPAVIPPHIPPQASMAAAMMHSPSVVAAAMPGPAAAQQGLAGKFIPSNANSFPNPAAAALNLASGDLPALQRLRAYAEQASTQAAAANCLPGGLMQGAVGDPALMQKIMLGYFGEQERQRLEAFSQQERQRLEMEAREKQQEQLRRDYELAAKTAMAQTPTPVPGPQLALDPRQLIEFQQRLAIAAAGGVLPPGGFPVPGVPMDQQAAMERMERLHAEQWLRSDERHHLERLAAHDPAARHRLEQMLAMASGNPQHHTHSHTHSHTHLHIHPTGANSVGPTPPVSAPSVAPISQPSVSNAEAFLQLHAATAGARPPGGLTLPTVHANAIDQQMIAAMEASRLSQMASVGIPPGADPAMVERAMLQRQEQLQRQMILERHHAAALQHNEMMRRLQQEGSSIASLPGVLRPPHP